MLATALPVFAWMAPIMPRSSTAVLMTAAAADTKATLLRSALLSGRGAWARPDERDNIASLVAELEATTSGDAAILEDGTWELIASDVEPFRASTFFLALGEAVEGLISRGASDGALTVHSLATGGGEVGRVAHVVEGGGTRLHSLVELRSGSLPSIPLALAGTVISSGELSASSSSSTSAGAAGGGDGTAYSLLLRNTTVQESQVKYGLPSDGGLKPGVEGSVLQWIGDQLVPSGDIFERVLDPLGGAPAAELRLTYSDGDLMIWRTPRLGDHFFVLARGSAEAWPAMEELRRRQATASQSTLGSLAALGMLNPFFTRAAGLRGR